MLTRKHASFWSMSRRSGGQAVRNMGTAHRPHIFLLNARLHDPLQGGLGLALGVHKNVHFPLLIG